MTGVRIRDPLNLTNALSINIAGFEFEGPFLSHLGCEEAPGILAIVKFKPGKNLAVINLYQSANVRSSAYLELSYYAQTENRILVAALYTKDCSAQISSNLATRLLESISLL